MTTATTPRNFTEEDVKPSDSWAGRIECRRSELIDAPLWYHNHGRSQTSSGYGRKLTTPYKIMFNGRALRVYCCIWSNSGTAYIVSKKREIIIDAF